MATDPRVVYHALIPHPAFAPVPDDNVPSTVDEQARNEAAYRQLLVLSVLAVLLPAEDLRNPCLRTLVTDVVGDTILGNGIGGKTCEGWMIWEGIGKFVENVRAQIAPRAMGPAEVEAGSRSRLEKFGVLSEGGQRARRVASRERQKGTTRRKQHAISQAFWRILQYAYLTFTTIHFIVLGLVAASTSGVAHGDQPPSRSAGIQTHDDMPPMAARSEALRSRTPARRPILEYSIFGLVSQLLGLSSRMPWTCEAVSLVRYHLVSGALRVGAVGGMLDK